MNIYIVFHTGLVIGFILGRLSDDLFPKPKKNKAPSDDYLFDSNNSYFLF